MKNIEYITAGAGSGKTFTLTEKLADEIANGLKTDQIILTTFTKAAAEEFKIKAAAKLNAKGLHSEAQQLSGAMIGTIDSVSQTFVQKYWHLLGMSPELNVMGDSEKNFYQTDSLINSRLVTSANIAFFEKVRKTFDIMSGDSESTRDDVDFWKDDLLRVIDLSRNYGIASLTQSQAESVKLIDSIFDKKMPINWSFVLTPPSKIFKKDDVILPNGKKGSAVLPDGTLSLASKTKKYKTILEASSLAGNFKYFYDGTSIYDENGSVCNGRKGSPIAECDIINYSAQCQDYLESSDWGDILKQYVETICSIATKWQTKYSRYKTEHHLVDFNDIELKFKELLTKPQVQNEIRDQYKLVMVDEFQDCNPLQVEIFDILSDIVAGNPTGGKSVWVGDEKQSIYGFRGSNMAFIQSVIAQFPPVKTNSNGLSQDTLPYSFRSRKKLVDVANKMVGSMFGGGALTAIRKVNVNGSDVDDLDYALGDPTHAIYNWHSTSTNKDGCYDALAEQVKALIDGSATPKNILKDYKTKKDAKGNPIYDETTQVVSTSITAGDICILARGNSDVTAIVNKLNNLGVNVNAVESDIKEMAEIQLLMAILNYSLQKNDYSRAQILYLWDNKKVEDIIDDKINKRNWSVIPILKEIDDVLSASKGLSVFQLIETLLLRLDVWNHVAKWGNVSRRHANINTFLRIAQGYEEHTRLLDLACSVMGFISYFNSDNVGAETPFVKDPEAVSVITYHKSKGLEWPIVILASLENEPLNEQSLIKRDFFGVHNYATNPSSTTCNGRGEYLTIFPRVVSGSSSLPNALMSKVSSRVKSGGDIYEKAKAENSRLLYVGFTRARDYVMTLTHEPATRGKKITPYAWLMSLDDGKGMLKGMLVDDTNSGNVIFSTDIPTVNVPATAVTYDVITNSPINTGSSADDRYISPSTLGKSGAPVKAQTPVPVSKPITLSVDRVPMNEVGTCIHDIYAVYDEKIAATDMVEKAKQICEMHNRNDIKSQAGDFIDAIAKLYDYLTKKYGAATEIYHELPVMHKLANGQIMNGEIDLLWYLPDGKAIIVDFKSMKDDNTVVTDADLMKKGDGYAPQICAYKDAVMKNGITVEAMVLFFPMQGKIVELK